MGACIEAEAVDDIDILWGGRRGFALTSALFQAHVKLWRVFSSRGIDGSYQTSK
ncbi:hypothetical protein [Bartonella sp. ML71XJBT]|uniref:hypothetical protein n=1 Tax=Bartonella sp. ML71XJBT TaxID=3019094 RepID=UPI0023611965|nr:hypothetical protein [Bartonella sp. ML71XJBT]